MTARPCYQQGEKKQLGGLTFFPNELLLVQRRRHPAPVPPTLLVILDGDLLAGTNSREQLVDDGDRLRSIQFQALQTRPKQRSREEVGGA